MKKIQIEMLDGIKTGFILASIVGWVCLLLNGCVTSKAPDGTTVKQVDKEAIAQAVAVTFEILHDPAVSNALYQASHKQ